MNKKSYAWILTLPRCKIHTTMLNYKPPRTNRRFYSQMIRTKQVNKSNEEEIKKIYQLSNPEPGEFEFRVDGSVWKNGKLIAERPTEEQEEWVKRRMRGSAKSWEVVFI